MSEVAIVTSYHSPRLEMRQDPDRPRYTPEELDAYRDDHDGDDPPPTPLLVRAQCDTDDCPWEGEWRRTTPEGGPADGQANGDAALHAEAEARHSVTVTVALEPGDFAAAFNGDGEEFGRAVEDALRGLPGGVSPKVTVARLL